MSPSQLRIAPSSTRQALDTARETVFSSRKPRLLRNFAGLWTLAFLFGSLGCGEAPTGPNIVILVQDTVRPDRLSVYGSPEPTSPFLESFAAEGTRFDRAYSSSSWTLPAHASLFTGASAAIHGATQSLPAVNTTIPLLAEQLDDAGYQTAAFSANMWVSELAGLHRGFEHFENLNKGIYPGHILELASDPQGVSRPPDTHYVVRQVLRWLDEGREASRPYFLFINLVDPHMPYLPDWHSAREFLPSRQARFEAIRRYYPNAKPARLLLRHYFREDPLSADEWQTLAAMYDGTLRLVDTITDTIVSAIDQRSDPDNTLVFILSDHGENLGDHGHVGHFFNLYDSNLRILLLARGPGFPPGSVEKTLVQIGDIYTTALGAAGITPPEHSSGVDLRQPLPEHRVLEASLEYPKISLDVFKRIRPSKQLERYEVALKAAVGPRYKLIQSTTTEGQLVREEIFDILNDPDEQHPLTVDAVDPPALAALRAVVAEKGTAPRGQANNLEEIDPESREALQALGYLSDDDPPEMED